MNRCPKYPTLSRNDTIFCIKNRRSDEKPSNETKTTHSFLATSSTELAALMRCWCVWCGGTAVTTPRCASIYHTSTHDDNAYHWLSSTHNFYVWTPWKFWRHICSSENIFIHSLWTKNRWMVAFTYLNSAHYEDSCSIRFVAWKSFLPKSSLFSSSFSVWRRVVFRTQLSAKWPLLAPKTRTEEISLKY